MEGPVYTERVVMYADILGFTKAVNEPKAGSVPGEGLVRMLHAWKNTDPSLTMPDAEFSMLSDSLFMSGGNPNSNTMREFLRTVGRFQVAMLFNGFALRGGVAVGEVYHKDNIVFGPAVVEAVNLEKRIAVYPRVVLSEAARDRVETARVLEDSDGLHYVDFLPDSDDQLLTTPLEETYDRVRRAIVSGLRSSDHENSAEARLAAKLF